MERSKGHPRGNLRSMGDQDPDGERWALPRGWPCDKERKVRMVPNLAVTNLLQTPTVRSLLIYIKLLLEIFESPFFVQLTWMSWWTEIQRSRLPAVSGQTRWGAAESFHKTEQREEQSETPRSIAPKLTCFPPPWLVTPYSRRAVFTLQPLFFFWSIDFRYWSASKMVGALNANHQENASRSQDLRSLPN